MRLQTRHVIPRHLTHLLFGVLCTMGVGCAGSDEEARTATVVQLSYSDVDKDGNADLFFTTRSDDAFVSTRLLNQGAGHFTVQQSPAAATITPGGAIELQFPDEWNEAMGEGHIAELEGDLVGLRESIEMLTDDHWEALGVDNRGRARGYYDCPTPYACGSEHAYWDGWMYIVREGFNVPNVGAAINDKITAIRNTSSRCWVDWWEHANYAGDHYGLAPQNENPNVGAYWNDKFTSVHWGLGC